jgi:hypothetical protein
MKPLNMVSTSSPFLLPLRQYCSSNASEDAVNRARRSRTRWLSSYLSADRFYVAPGRSRRGFQEFNNGVIALLVLFLAVRAGKSKAIK